MSDDEVMHPALVLVEAARAMYESNMGHIVHAGGQPIPWDDVSLLDAMAYLEASIGTSRALLQSVESQPGRVRDDLRKLLGGEG